MRCGTADNVYIPCLSSPPLELKAQQKLNYLWLLSSFRFLRRVPLPPARKMAGAFESWSEFFSLDAEDVESGKWSETWTGILDHDNTVDEFF